MSKLGSGVAVEVSVETGSAMCRDGISTVEIHICYRDLSKSFVYTREGASKDVKDLCMALEKGIRAGDELSMLMNYNVLVRAGEVVETFNNIELDR